MNLLVKQSDQNISVLGTLLFLLECFAINEISPTFAI